MTNDRTYSAQERTHAVRSTVVCKLTAVEARAGRHMIGARPSGRELNTQAFTRTCAAVSAMWPASPAAASELGPSALAV